MLKDTEIKKGMPRWLLLTMAVMAGLTVANLYYNQPLLAEMRASVGLTEQGASLVTFATQAAYAVGLLLIIPLGDMIQRRRLIMCTTFVAGLMAMLIALSTEGWQLWTCSAILGLCSVTPQLFIPIAGQYSNKEDKARNIGIVLSGLLTGILASRVVSGIIGEALGWRWMFGIAAILMACCCATVCFTIPTMKRNFEGSYSGLMLSVWRIFRSNGEMRLYALRAALGFGSMLAIWSSLAFHLEGSPLQGGAREVGLLGLCGMAGVLMAANVGKYIPRYGIDRFSIAGGLLQIVAWSLAWLLGDSYVGLALAIIIVDIGVQCLQLSNQSGCLALMPEASNRANTIFMTIYFIGGSLGTLLSSIAWNHFGWSGVCTVGILFAIGTLMVTTIKKIYK